MHSPIHVFTLGVSFHLTTFLDGLNATPRGAKKTERNSEESASDFVPVLGHRAGHVVENYPPPTEIGPNPDEVPDGSARNLGYPLSILTIPGNHIAGAMCRSQNERNCGISLYIRADLGLVPDPLASIIRLRPIAWSSPTQFETKLRWDFPGPSMGGMRWRSRYVKLVVEIR